MGLTQVGRDDMCPVTKIRTLVHRPGLNDQKLPTIAKLCPLAAILSELNIACMIKIAIPLLRVSDPTLAEKFYCDQLGFKKTFDYHPFGETGPCYFGIVRDGINVHLSSFPGDGIAGNAVVLVVDNVDSFYKEYSEKGIKIDLSPIDQSWGNREMYINDTDNNSIRFTQWMINS